MNSFPIKKKILPKRLLAIILVALICAIIPLTLSTEIVTAASTTTYGTVNDADGLNVRIGPGTSYSWMGTLSYGATVEVVDYEAGQTWYEIVYNGKQGYVYATYLTVTEPMPDIPYDSDGDFEEYLDEQGFPESYKAALRTLHAKYPEWKFVANHTNLDWEDVIEEETDPVSTSLVHYTYADSYKSMEKGAYSFTTDSYTVFDSGGWVAASEQAVAYYMDPRNSLSENYIFQFLSARYDEETQTSSNLQTILNGTFMSGKISGTSKTYNSVLLDAGETYGANPLVLASMILTEQGTNGTGASISGTVSGYKGIYNYFNVRAYSSGSYDAVEYGLLYASGSGDYGRPWNTVEKSILGGTEHYADSYVNNNKYSIYLKKWNVMNGLSSVGTGQYMTNIMGARTEGYILSEGYEDIKDSAITFEIPVYLNMPSSAVSAPSTTGNNDNYLEGITVSNCSITPTFDRYTYSYEGVVSYSYSSVNINAILSDSGASVSGDGTVSLNVGTNTIKLVVTSSSGEDRTYTLKIVREAAPAGSDDYSVGDYLTGPIAGTSVSEFKSNVEDLDDITFSSVKILSSSGSEVTSGNIGTGMVAKFLDSSGNTVKEITIVVKGDVSGDGKISALDYVNIRNHIMETSIKKGAYAEAADTSGDGKVSALDYVQIRNHIMGDYVIQ